MIAKGGTDLADKAKKYAKMSQEQLLREVIQLNLDNNRLRNRINDHEPFKQKLIRPPNQQKIDKLLKESTSKKFALKVCYLGWNYDGMSCQA
jgi:regulator of replication initiation timing